MTEDVFGHNMTEDVFGHNMTEDILVFIKTRMVQLCDFEQIIKERMEAHEEVTAHQARMWDECGEEKERAWSCSKRREMGGRVEPLLRGGKTAVRAREIQENSTLIKERMEAHDKATQK